LTPDDLPRRNQILPGEDRRAGETPVFVHDLDTAGILYADVLFSLDQTPPDLLPLLPLFGRALTEMGTKHRDYVDLGLKLAAHTGGLDAGPLFAAVRGERAPSAWLHVGGKATHGTIDRLFDLMTEILCEPCFTDPERFTHMALEERARMEQALIPAGHSLVATRLRARFAPSSYLAELTGGITYLQVLRDLTDQLERDPGPVLADLETLRRLILRRDAMLVNLTADAKLLDAALPLADRLGAALPSFAAATRREYGLATLPPGEVLRLPAQVNYVGQGANLFDLGYVWHGSAQVVIRHLRMAWLWDQVRVQGGAYGVFCGLDRLTGSWTQVSYRDPNVAATLAAYAGAAAWLRTLSPDGRELGSAIVGAIGDLDAHLLPDAKGMASLIHRLSRDDEATRQTLREEILGTTAADFRRFADALEAARDHSAVVVLGGDKAEQEGRERGWEIVTIL
ncbi:MAG: peptidase M16, partial [Deltaproteobacteria bacterium]|nr:peptidase M16 [Deltaproteobacteria bacterium]